MLIRAAAIVVFVMCLAACGATATSTDFSTPSNVRTATAAGAVPFVSPAAPDAGTGVGRAAWPDCAALAGQKVDIPGDFAPGFPFPNDIHVVRANTESNGTYTQLRVFGVTAFGLREADAYIQSGLASAGYQLSGHDSEQSEADGLFMGNGWIGSYQVRVFDDCAKATTWSVLVLKL